MSSFYKIILLLIRIICCCFKDNTISDISELSNLIQEINNNITSENGPPHLQMISLANTITSFKIPDKDEMKYSLKSLSHITEMIFQIDSIDATDISSTTENDVTNIDFDMSAPLETRIRVDDSELVVVNFTAGRKKREDKCEQLQRHIVSLKNNFNLNGIRIGFKSSQTSYCSLPTPDFILSLANFPTGLPTSYSIFQNHLTSVLEVENSSLIFQLKTDPSREHSSAAELNYDLFLLQYGRRFTVESGYPVIIKMSNYTHFPQLGEKVTSIENKVGERNNHLILSSSSFACPPSASEWQNTFHWMSKVSSVFEKVLFRNPVSSGSCVPYDRLEKISQKLVQPLNATIEMEFKDAVNLNSKAGEILAIIEESQKKNLFLGEIFLYFKSLSEAERVGEINLKNLFGNTPIGCGPRENLSSVIDRPELVLEKTRKWCGSIFTNSSHFHWPLTLDKGEAQRANFSFDYFEEIILKYLGDALISREELWRVKPEAKVALKIHVEDSLYWIESFSVYCNSEKFGWNTYLEGIGNWARIHNFPVFILSEFPISAVSIQPLPFQLEKKPWSVINLGDEISPKIVNDYPHIVLRNFPESFLNVKVDPCVVWSEKKPERSIPLDKDFSGISVSMDLKEEFLSRKELETTLLFALDKFKTVELLMKKGEGELADLKTLNSLLETDFLEALVDFDVLDGSLYLQISVEDEFFPEKLQQLESLAEKIYYGPSSGLRLAGVHVTSWDGLFSPETVIHEVVAVGRQYNFKVGIVEENCPELLSDLAANSNVTTSFPHSDYILCQTKHFQAHNNQRDVIAMNLEMDLYLSRTFQKFIDKRPIYFRLDSSPCCEGDSREKETENLLRFLNDVNQFAVGNQLKYFLVQAFTTTRGSFSSSSMFYVTSYTNLSDPFVFIDREEEFHLPSGTNSSTRRPKLINFTNRETPFFKSTTVVWMVVVVGVVIFVGIIVSIVKRDKFNYVYTVVKR